MSVPVLYNSYKQKKTGINIIQAIQLNIIENSGNCNCHFIWRVSSEIGLDNY